MVPENTQPPAGERYEWKRDPRPYIALTNEYHRHRKIRGLSDAAFRVHVMLMLLANEETTDGVVEKTDLYQRGPKVAKELLAAGLVHETGDGYVLHDYLRHQKPREELIKLSQANAKNGHAGGIRSAHGRWHVDRGVLSDDCALCQKFGLDPNF